MNWDKIRESLFGGQMNQQQVDGINTILDAWKRSGYTDKRWLAYMLATVYHETAKTMQPIREYGRGRNMRYGRRQKFSGEPYKEPHIYYGRGYVQLTWYENYKLMGDILNIDLLNNPDLALRPDVSVRILFEGMTRGISKRGDFTGVSLEDYFNSSKCDWVGARRIINGYDKAQQIAQYAKIFYDGIK